MRPLPEIVRDFFRTTDMNVRRDPIIGSARLAVRAYVSTANVIHGRLDLTERGADAARQEMHDFNLPATYRDAAFESIVLFQHFSELVLKEVLRAKHELLVAITGDHHDLLSRLLEGEALGPEDSEGLHAIEASVALQRTCALLQAGRIDASWDFIRASREFLQQINALRNRLWHRGTLVLRYRALDELFGGHALPFLFEVMRQPAHAQHATLWKHNNLHCALDPLPLLAAEMRNQNWSVEKVAFLKELARAAYENPLIPMDFFEDDNERLRARAQSMAREHPDHGVYEVIACPVCGADALVIYADTHDPEDAAPVSYTWLAKCELCTLELRREYGNPSTHGLVGIRDLWLEF